MLRDFDTMSTEYFDSPSLINVGLWRSLGARFHGMEEVVGSIPTRSTIQLPLNSETYKAKI